MIKMSTEALKFLALQSHGRYLLPLKVKPHLGKPMKPLGKGIKKFPPHPDNFPRLQSLTFIVCGLLSSSSRFFDDPEIREIRETTF